MRQAADPDDAADYDADIHALKRAYKILDDAGM